ncbi:helix-turn-helix domain-containing protein [Shinella sp. BYT-45]|uniref:helix-turn-helix domain-containing protein n=1 Tax=Shinella sp. BYT-45 TaxID=3377377 RepID=UPI00397F43F1
MHQTVGFRAVYAFLKEQRLLKARRVIERGELNVTPAAIAVGYSNPCHFSQLFLRRFGMQPSRALAVRAGEGSVTETVPFEAASSF